MTTALKAIETWYLGYPFRSRTEARWAVFLKEAGIVWSYEHEGYDLDGVWYLPDFYVRAQGYWIEVKPTRPTPGTDAWLKVARLSLISKRPVVVLIDQPDIAGEMLVFTSGQLARWRFRWTRCIRCGLVEPARDGDGAYVSCPCFRAGIDCYPGWNDPVLLEAFGAARAERFGT